jgi:SAM-dependent methyltransferase
MLRAGHFSRPWLVLACLHGGALRSMEYDAWKKQTEIRLRSAAPSWLKRLYRRWRSLQAPSLSPELRPDVTDQCRFVASREILISQLPKGGVVAEIGTETGYFARRILEFSQPKELHLIDIDFSKFDSSGLALPHVTRHSGLSTRMLSQFPDAHFDWIYIDADHSYNGVRADAAASAAKLRPGGYLIFNDFGHIDPFMGRYGVHRAVVEFINETGWQMRWFSYNSLGLYDVAIQRPKTETPSS